MSTIAEKIKNKPNKDILEIENIEIGLDCTIEPTNGQLGDSIVLVSFVSLSFRLNIG
jgi:hypothetical protein